MQTREIPDSALTSSSFMDQDLGPTSARIRNEKNGGAWCPKEQISKESFEYLQIDLGSLKVITMIETQGHFGHGQGQEYTEQYMVNYQREDGGSWFRFRNRRDQTLFQGNANTYIAELRDVSPAIIARKIRIIPYSTHPKYVCLRVELYGCLWLDGVVSYDMHQGEKRGVDLEFYDFTYDGVSSDGSNYLSGGLGQLTDGEEGQSNFRLDPKGLGRRGYEWIGWKSETFGDDPVEITFKFDCVRNFSLVQIFGNNLFSREVRIFNAAKVFVSNDGQAFVEDPPIEFVYTRDSLVEYARSIVIPMKNRIGRYVKIWFFFDSKWILISEVHFESERIFSNGSDDELSASVVLVSNGNSINRTKNISIVQLESNEGRFDFSLMPDNAIAFPATYSYDNINSKSAHLIRQETFMTMTTIMSDVESKDNRQSSDKYIAIIVGVLSGLTFALFAVIIVVFIRHRRYTCMPLPYPLPKITKPVMTIYDAPTMTAKPSLTPPSRSPDVDEGCEPIYDNIPAAGAGSQQHWRPSSTIGCCGTEDDIESTLSSVETTSQEKMMMIMRQKSGCNSEQDNNLCLRIPTPSDPLILSSHQIRLIERIGESRFGEVHLSEVNIEPETQQCEGNASKRRAEKRQMLVIVRWLKSDSNDQMRADFSRELKDMLLVRNYNIAQVVGLCMSDDDLFGSRGILIEYVEYGDLKTFLQRHVTSEVEGGGGGGVLTMTIKKKKRDGKIILSYGSLVFMATQITSGMKEMESLNLTHRDLSARNCLIGQNYVVKVADLGRSFTRHVLDYSCVDGYVGLPIRWMSWEAILTGKFSTKSDIWSFAITLWEILTLARCRPLDSLTDEQVIENCNHIYLNNGLELCLDQPGLCTKEIYDLMIECCHRDESKRPSFKEIHMFLQRKNMGYKPNDGQSLEVL